MLRDLGIYEEASVGQIHGRIGKEIPLRKLRRAVDELRNEGLILAKGERKGRRYLLPKTAENGSAPVNKSGQ